MPKLTIAEAGDETVYEIFDDEVGLGRGAANAVQIHGDGASKMHAVIRRLQGHWKVIDLESRNGTKVNGRFQNQHWLSDGDALLVGEATVRYAAEGAPEGPPAAAASASVPPAKAVAAKAVAVPAAQAPRPVAFEEPLAPSAASAPAVARAEGPARRRRGPRDEDRYDDDYDEDDMPPPRRRNNNTATIVVLGVLGAAAFLAAMFAIFSGGDDLNQRVFLKADNMADEGHYEEALRYAEQNADPDRAGYWAVVKGIAKWKNLIKAKKQLAFEAAAQKQYDYEIFRKQAVTGRRKGGFRALDAYSERDVARLLRELLLDYPASTASLMVIGSKQVDLRHLRDCMLENRDPDLKSGAVILGLSAQHDIDVSARRFGKAYTRLDYLRNAYRLIMTSENYTEFRKAIQFKIDDVLATARVKWVDDESAFDKALANGRKAKARQKYNDMTEGYGGIPDFATKLKALDQRL